MRAGAKLAKISSNTTHTHTHTSSHAHIFRYYSRLTSKQVFTAYSWDNNYCTECSPYLRQAQQVFSTEFLWCGNRDNQCALMWPQAPPSRHALNFAWGEHCCTDAYIHVYMHVYTVEKNQTNSRLSAIRIPKHLDSESRFNKMSQWELIEQSTLWQCIPFLRV